MLIACYLWIAYHANQLWDWFMLQPVNKGQDLFWNKPCVSGPALPKMQHDSYITAFTLYDHQTSWVTFSFFNTTRQHIRSKQRSENCPLASIEYGKINCQQRLWKITINNRNLQTSAQHHNFAVNKHKMKKKKIIQKLNKVQKQKYSWENMQ